jgi:hypothetical protein
VESATIGLPSPLNAVEAALRVIDPALIVLKEPRVAPA